MSLCIAARAVAEDGSPCVVCCFDTSVETAVAGSEHRFKLRSLAKGWSVFTTGSTAEADHLLKMYKLQLEDPGAEIMTPSNSLRSVAWKYKEFLVDRYLRSTFAISRKEFYSSTHGHLTPSITEQAFYEISTIESECELILFKITMTSKGGGFAELYRVDRHFSVIFENDFTSIGAGAVNSDSWLHFRGQHSRVGLNDTIYNLYEAKRFGETLLGIERAAFILIVDAEGGMAGLQAEHFKELDARYKKFGPRSLKANTAKFDIGRAKQLVGNQNVSE
jgi:hypothetical protein